MLKGWPLVTGVRLSRSNRGNSDERLYTGSSGNNDVEGLTTTNRGYSDAEGLSSSNRGNSDEGLHR